MFGNGILKIAFLCITIGAASIPVSFTVNSDPAIVWLGNAIGSLFSALFVIFVGDRITSPSFRRRLSKWRPGRKVAKLFDEGDDNKKVKKAGGFINRHGLRIFSLLCPIFPGVTLSTIAVYILGLDKRIYKKWMLSGVVFVSWIYVYGYWWLFVK